MNKREWNTYDITGYTHQRGTDQRATGAVHLHQVKQTVSGNWQRRAVDSNGRFKSAGPVQKLSRAEGEQLYSQAEAR